ncbi:MAG: beta-lactamase family protein [Sphingobacteriales bacterium]|nr:beta-lactamase family protein [Sphingobacteriales bacterium]
MKVFFTVIGILISWQTFSQTLKSPILDDYLKSNQSEIMGLKRGFDVKIMKDNQVLYRYQKGNINDDTPILIASASKWLSAAVIMKLVDERKISLDDPLKKFFPNVDQAKAEITIRQLFSHTSGLPGKGTFELVRMNRKSMAKQADEILGKDLDASPGTAFSYGGESMQIAGRIAEIVSKKDFETLFQEEIAKPLGMSKTTFSKNGKTPQVAGGATSTVNDYLKFLEMLANKGVYQQQRILTEQAVAEMLANQIGNHTIIYSPFTQYADLFSGEIKIKYGIGNWREENANGDLLDSSSPGAFGFSPWIDFQHHYYGVFGAFKSMKSVFPVYVGFRDRLNAQLK